MGVTFEVTFLVLDPDSFRRPWELQALEVWHPPESDGDAAVFSGIWSVPDVCEWVVTPPGSVVRCPSLSLGMLEFSVSVLDTQPQLGARLLHLLTLHVSFLLRKKGFYCLKRVLKPPDCGSPGPLFIQNSDSELGGHQGSLPTQTPWNNEELDKRCGAWVGARCHVSGGPVPSCPTQLLQWLG